MEETRSIPRTLLLTWQRPDGRYAGAELIRKTVGEFPPDRIRWAYLSQPVSGGDFGGVRHLGIEPRHLHWRLQNTVLRYLHEQHLQARGLALRIAQWAAPFKPEVLWVLAELGAVTVGKRLRERLGVPVHATVHDAYEFGQLALPRRYYPIYRRGAYRFLSRCRSMDVVCPELLTKLRGACSGLDAKPALLYPPSIRRANMQDACAAPPPTGVLRRIGLCGSMRIDPWQWREFLSRLGAMPFTFEFLAYVDRASFFDAPLPPNVSLVFCEYRPESELVRILAESQVWACYLGISRTPADAVFSRYSLSSKLTTYAAAGLPVIVDAPRDSGGWRMAERHGAGVLYDGSDTSRSEVLRLFQDPELWRCMAAASAQMCRSEFSLEKNVGQFQELLARTAAQTHP